MTERLSSGDIRRTGDLACQPTNIPVTRVLGLQELMMSTPESVACTQVFDESPWRRGWSSHYETRPFGARNPNDLFDNPDDDPDQSTHMTFQVKQAGAQGLRMAFIAQQYSLNPHSPVTRHYSALQWRMDDLYVVGARREEVIVPTVVGSEPSFIPIRYEDDALIFDEPSRLVEQLERPLYIDDIDALEQQVLTLAELKSRQAPRRLP